MANFEFVVNDGAPKKVTAAIRSHAVRSGLHRKTTAKAAGSRDSQLTIRQKSTLKGRFRLAEKPRQPVAVNITDKPPGPRDTPDDEQRYTTTSSSEVHNRNGRAHRKSSKNSQLVVVAPSQAHGDPFNSFPISQSEGVDRLIRFYISRFDIQISISQIQKHWWGFAIYDPVVLHATLSLAATTWAMMIPEPDVASKEGIKQKGYALRGVQKRLDQNDTSDAVVGAVAALASVEAAEGDFRAGVTHIKGVQLLCKARGGYSVFKDNLHVARAMNWADLQVAVGMGSRPLLPLLHPLSSISLPSKVLSLAAEPSLSHLRVFESSQGDASIRYSFSVLRQAYHGLKNATLSVHDLRVVINGADYQLAHAIAGDNITPQGRAVLLAAQFFMHHIVRETQVECHIPVLLVQRLSAQLDALQNEIASTPEMWNGLLWCFSLGAAATPVSGDKWEFYSTNVWNLIRMMGIAHTTDFETVVRRFIWDDSLSHRLLAHHRLPPSIT